MNQTVARKILTVLLTLVMALALFFGASTLLLTAKADDETPADYSDWQSTVSVENGSLSGEGASTPSSWSVRTEPGYAATVKSGVVDISAYASITPDVKTDKYGLPSTINTPYGATDDAIAFVNATTKTIRGFSSPTINMAANSYYKITVWAKTSNATASITLKGLKDEPVGIMNINTEELLSSQDENGWCEFTIYVETGYEAAPSVTVDLLIGSPVTGGESSGIVYFDNLSVTELSSKLYFNNKADSFTVKSISTFDTVIDTNFDSVNNFTVSVAEATAVTSLYDLNGGLPYSGKKESVIRPAFDDGNENKVVAIFSEYDEDDETYTAQYGGVKRREPFTIERFGYYRISGWFLAVDDANATVTLESRNVLVTDDDFVSESLTLSYAPTKNNHNAWQEFVIFVKGSDRFDYLLNTSLCLGSESAPSEGVVFFDDISFEKITPALYNADNANANKTLTFDVDPNTNGITNGWMNSVDSYENWDGDILKNPLAPIGWTKQTTSSVNTTGGYAKVEVSTDDAVSGLISIDGNAVLAENKGIEYGNALMLSSATPTAFCYESSTFSVAANAYTALSVGVVASDVDGYGANLVLKSGTTVVGSIEKINTNGEYTFYIKGDNAEKTLTVELWLGLNDRQINNTKLASGTVYFTFVKFDSASTQEVFDAKYASYANDRYTAKKYAAINLGDEDLSAFDVYDESGLAYPYNWSLSSGNANLVKYGIFDAQHNNRNVVPSTYDNGDQRYALVLRNSGATYSTLTLDNAFTLAADKYYKLSFSAKTDLSSDTLESKDAIGAFISIGTGYRFDFKATEKVVDNVVDKEYFRTYTFYIKSSSAESTTNIVIGLGGGIYTKNYAQGTLYINDISLEEITDLQYSDITSALADGENVIDEYTMRANFANAIDEEEEEEITPSTTPSTDLWWLIPSILLGVAVVIAVVGTLIRKAIENRPKKTAKVDTVSSYDRRRINFEEGDEAKAEPTEIPAEEIEETETATEQSETSEQAETTVATETVDEVTEETPEVTETASENQESESVDEDKKDDGNN